MIPEVSVKKTFIFTSFEFLTTSQVSRLSFLSGWNLVVEGAQCWEFRWFGGKDLVMVCSSAVSHLQFAVMKYMLSLCFSWLPWLFYLFIFYLTAHVACGILVPRPGVEPMLPALVEWSLNHWPAREVLIALTEHML